jgi:hypothetical protein
LRSYSSVWADRDHDHDRPKRLGERRRRGEDPRHRDLLAARGSVDLLGSVRQQRANGATLGYFDGSVSCSGMTRWRARVVGETGFYRPGRVRATVAATFTDELRGETTDMSTAENVTLHLR